MFQEITRDPIIEDLIYSHRCVPIRTGIYSIKTFWKLKKIKVISNLLGDEDGIYVEIEYVIGPLRESNKELLKLL